MAIRITAALREHLVKSFQLAADADDAAASMLVSEKMMSGELGVEKVKELTAARPESENRFKAMMEETARTTAEAVTKALVGAGLVQSPQAGGANAATAASGTGTAAAPATKAADPNAPSPAKAMLAFANAGGDGATLPAGGGDDVMIRVKSVVERFADNRTAATWDKSANEYLKKNFGYAQLTNGQGEGSYSLDMPTPRSKAIAGAWFKHLINKDCRSRGAAVPHAFRLNEQDQMLIKYAVHECSFVGPCNFEEPNELWFNAEKASSDLMRKALLDDSTSGGLEAVPIEFDAAVILTPLLNGELFPNVRIINVTRRRIEATEVGNPTMSWGISEGTAISLFNTDSFISAFDNNIYPLTGAMELGRDFLSDSPLDIGGIVVERYGQRFLQVMDNVIATGNGTNQPEGLFTASGTATVNSAGGAGAAPQVGDYEALAFGVAKEFRMEAGARPMYVGTDTSYRRARGIAVDSTDDARRVFGMDQQSYTVFGWPYKVNGSLTNAQIGFFCMNRYRMYRRQGLEVRIVREDAELARRNQELVVVRARFGGALELGGAGAVISDGQV